ncbi:MAG: hypothetical protein IJZ82_00650 [Lachnospiraceae bacterium]|nr:hypothetical protein [Lachnospiraceae bacterium]
MLEKILKKIGFVVAFIVYLILYCFVTVLVFEDHKVAYVLVLISATAVLIYQRNDPMNILSFWAIVSLPYSILVLCGLEADVLVDKFGPNVALLAFLVVAELLAHFSGKIVIIVMFFLIPLFFVGLFLVFGFIYTFRVRWRNWIHGEFPHVKGIVKKDRNVYFSHDHHHHQMQVIYRKGRRKKVLDTYPYRLDSYQHFSLEWEKEDSVMVRRYDNWKHVIMMEKELELPRN